MGEGVGTDDRLVRLDRVTGDAGDELFSGYERYFVGSRLWNKISAVPPWGRKLAAQALTMLSARTLNRMIEPCKPVLPAKLKHLSVGDKMHKLAEVLQVSEPVTMYQNLVSHWKNPQQIVIGGHEPVTALIDHRGWPRVPDFTHRMMHLDMETYLPGDILTKVDIASMAHALEVRCPFLDTDVIEFCARLSPSSLSRVRGKYLLRKATEGLLPDSVRTRADERHRPFEHVQQLR